MLATELQDILFGTPYPGRGEVNLGVLKKDEVNIIVHGHEPILSEMIVAASQGKDLLEEAKKAGAKGINVAGICCTANELLMRHGVPIAGNFLNQEIDTYSDDYFMNNLKHKAVQISNLLVHNPGVWNSEVNGRPV